MGFADVAPVFDDAAAALVPQGSPESDEEPGPQCHGPLAELLTAALARGLPRPLERALPRPPVCGLLRCLLRLRSRDHGSSSSSVILDSRRQDVITPSGWLTCECRGPRCTFDCHGMFVHHCCEHWMHQGNEQCERATQTAAAEHKCTAHAIAHLLHAKPGKLLTPSTGARASLPPRIRICVLIPPA